MTLAKVSPATILIDGIHYFMHPATIERTMLGYEDHGLFSLTIICLFDGGAQGFGPFAVDHDVATAMVKSILKALETRTWEELPRQRLYVLKQGESLSSIVRGIANIDEPETHHYIVS